MTVTTRYRDAQLYLGYLIGGRAGGEQIALRDVMPPDVMPDEGMVHVLAAVYQLGAAAHPMNVFAYCAERGQPSPAKAELLDWMSEAAGVSEEDFVDLIKRIRRDYAQERATELIALGRLEAAQDVITRYAGPPTPAQARARFALRVEEDLADIPDPEWLLQDELQRGGYHLLYGASGSGKTFYALDRSLRAAAAGACCVYVATEDLIGLKVRVAAWRSFNASAGGRLTWLEMPDGLDLSDAGQVDEMLAALAGQQFDLITIDTLREAHTGDENSSQDMAMVNRAIQRLIRETGAAVDLVHHSGVNEGRERGSTALGANCDLKWKVSSDDNLVTISCEKFRHGAPFTPRHYQITPSLTVRDGAVLIPTRMTTNRGDSPLSPNERKVLDTLALSIFSSRGAKKPEIAESTGIPSSTLFRVLSSLKDRGYLAQGSKGDPYTITTAGRTAINPDEQLSPPTAHQSAQLSQLSINSHELSERDHTPDSDSLSLSPPLGVRVRESRESGRERRQETESLPPPVTDAEADAYAAQLPPAWEGVQAAAEAAGVRPRSVPGPIWRGEAKQARRILARRILEAERLTDGHLTPAAD